jgi:hypothetical protein
MISTLLTHSQGVGIVENVAACPAGTIRTQFSYSLQITESKTESS